MLVTELVVGVNAVVGGVGLMVNGLGMSTSQLDGSPFGSYAVPGLVLAIAVGGATLGAAWAVWNWRRLSAVWSIAAGLVVIGWILGQVAMLGYVSLLQPIILALGLTIAVLGWHLLVEGRAEGDGLTIRQVAKGKSNRVLPR